MAQAETVVERTDQGGIDDASRPFIGQWHTLISTTNWEKGRIISQWRAAKQAAGEEVSEYSDEAWAALVGEVTSQHVGRLRRVFDRFGDVYGEYEGLYWSHFHAALDWSDAEIWLEGALQKRWSISQMRRQRDDAHGKLQNNGSADAVASGTTSGESAGEGSGELAEVVDPDDELADEEPRERSSATSDGDESAEMPAAGKATQPAKARPFEDLAELPDDLADAFEAMKLAILNHKLSGWEEVSRDDVIASLESLKQLALAPSE